MDFTVERIKREWSKVDEFPGPVSGTEYTAWLSPDKKLMAVVHEVGNELASVVDVKTWDFVYASPQTSRGALVLSELLRAKALRVVEERLMKMIEVVREIYPTVMIGFCAVCGKPMAESRRLLTCSEECHERLVERLVRKFGEFKRVVDAETGKAHRVPIRDIIERGLKHEDLAKYPLWDGGEADGL